jgi:hypothetical protein
MRAVVEPVVLDQLLDDRLLIAGVVNDEIAREPDVGGLAPEQPCAQRVKRRDPHRAAVRSEQQFHSRPHLFRGLVGEGDCQHAVGSRLLLGHEVGDAMRDDARLSRTRAGENQQRPARVLDSRPLFRIQ